MSPRRALLSFVVLAAAAAPAAAVLGGEAGPAGLALVLAAFAAAGVQGLPARLRRLRSGPRRRTLERTALGALLPLLLLLVLLGAASAPFLLALLPSGLRGFRRRTESRDLRTARDALLLSLGHLAAAGSGASLLSAAAVVLGLAALLPVMQAERAARAAREAGDGGEEGAPPPGVPVPAGRVLRASLLAVPATALLAALLFLSLPRFAGNAGEEPSNLARRERRAREDAALPGGGAPSAVLPSREVALGDIGRLQRDFRPILEVVFLRGGRPAPAEDLGPLLRSGALETFDGFSWREPERRFVLLEDRADGIEDGWIALPRRRVPAPPAGEPLEQRVRHLAGGSDSLFAAGIPTAVGGPAAAGGVLSLGRGEVRAADNLPEGAEVRIRSVAGTGPYPLLDDETLSRARTEALLAIPPGHERTAALARQVLGGAAPGAPTLRALEAWLAARCAWSLDLPRPVAGTPVEQFLFTSRRGHCELFASSAAVMLRALGIPARVAVGFRGGVLDPAASTYTFRGADAHAWVEAWFEDRGWVTFDPTPGEAGLPERDGEEDGAGRAAGGSWLDGVLRFDGAAQRRLLVGAARGARDLLRNSLLGSDGRARWGGIAALLAGLLLAGAALLLRGRRGAAAAGEAPAPAAPAPAPPPEAYALLLERMAAAGVPRLPAETAREHAARGAAAGLVPAAALARVVASFEEERWGGRAPAAGERVRLRDLAASVGRPAPPA